MIRILIVDDHAIVRAGLKQILADISDIEVSAEAASGDEAVLKLKMANWDMMLLDIAMPGRNVLEIIKLAKQHYPNKPILILSMYPEDQYAVRMLRSGADGYLTKASAPEQLVDAIFKLMQGEKYISSTLAVQLLTSLNVEQKNCQHQILSDREFQVFLGIAKGLRLSEIALNMALSIKTVSTFRTRIMKKMRMASNSEIISYAIAHNLLN